MTLQVTMGIATCSEDILWTKPGPREMATSTHRHMDMVIPVYPIFKKSIKLLIYLHDPQLNPQVQDKCQLLIFKNKH